MADLLSKVFLPISLAIIMFGMGMTLVPKDFGRVLKFPKSILIGLTNQFIFLPIIGFGICYIFNLEPVMAIGVMAMAVAPGGPTSNLITQVCRGNIALSVTLTALASFISILTIPFILSASIHYFDQGFDQQIELPIGQTILQIMVITLIPVSLGMLVRHNKESFAMRMERPMRVASTIIFILVFLAVIGANSHLLGRAMKEVGIPTLLLNLSTMGLGFFTARIFNLKFKNAISITIESGIQNGTLAFVIVTTILNNVEMGIPIGAYSIWMFMTGGFLMWYLGRKEVMASVT